MPLKYHLVFWGSGSRFRTMLARPPASPMPLGNPNCQWASQNANGRPKMQMGDPKCQWAAGVRDASTGRWGTWRPLPNAIPAPTSLKWLAQIDFWRPDRVLKLFPPFGSTRRKKYGLDAHWHAHWQRLRREIFRGPPAPKFIYLETNPPQMHFPGLFL